VSDKSKTGMPEDEKETRDLLALLYPDSDSALDESSSAPSDELLEMQSLRSLFRDMPEEEPSDAVSNKLMALAAQHAPKPASESRGLFAWFSDVLIPQLSHPGLAAAATLVLVVGVAGTLYVKGGAKLAQPNAPSNAAAPAREESGQPPAASSADVAPGAATTQSLSAAANEGSVPSEDPALDEVQRQEDEGSVRGGYADSSILKDLIDKKSGDQAQGRRRDNKGQNKSYAGKSAEVSLGAGESANGFGIGGGGAKDGVVGSAIGTGSREPTRKTATPSPSEPTATKTDRISSANAAPVQVQKPQKRSRPSPSSKPKPTPPPSTTPADSAPPPPQAEPSDDAESDSAASSEKKEKAKTVGPTAAALHKKAVQAASSGDCARVEQLGNQIRKIDSAYYDRTFLSDARIKACRAAL